MDLYKEVLINLLAESRMEVSFPELSGTIAELAERKCCQALKRIKEIIEDESLEDADCFLKIEEIVTTLEDIGSGGGSRHDF